MNILVLRWAQEEVPILTCSTIIIYHIKWTTSYNQNTFRMSQCHWTMEISYGSSLIPRLPDLFFAHARNHRATTGTPLVACNLEKLKDGLGKRLLWITLIYTCGYISPEVTHLTSLTGPLWPTPTPWTRPVFEYKNLIHYYDDKLVHHSYHSYRH